jgi:ATP-dependent DNA helicase RecG
VRRTASGHGRPIHHGDDVAAPTAPETRSRTSLGAAVTHLRGVGPKLAERLTRLGIVQVRDLLFHLPLRYEDRTRVTPIGALRADARAVIQGTIDLVQVQFGRRRSLLVRLSDGTGAVLLRFFHFSKAQQEGLARGMVLRCYGEVRRGRLGLELIHPEYRRIDPSQPSPVDETLTPVYPATEGVQQAAFRRLTDQALEILRSDRSRDLDDLIPAALLADENLPALSDAILFLHRPPPDVALETLESGTHPAQRRLIFDELLAHQLSLRRLRQRVREHRAPKLPEKDGLRQRFLNSLPFALTGAQAKVVGEIATDLAGDKPMLRLLQGDVGSGKTVVAALAALRAIENGYQAAVMAPTELLAEQHLRNFQRWFAPLDVPLLWLSGRLKRAERTRATQSVATLSPALVVGTHALFQQDVEFAKLGLVVVDEQHRFGVEQRLALSRKGGRGGQQEANSPHQLIMTATPIPRTLAMTAYADLDNSVIDELPPGRQAIGTVVVPDSRRDEVVARIAKSIEQGRQVYWVCTLIEESDLLQCQAATETATLLAEALAGARVGLVHGRMREKERDETMAAFAAGDIDLLVATTVIEVGVDVPNASLMIIENAERLGLSQLHQLRGRVGRGAVKSDCVLLYHAPLSAMARARLACMRETQDGFVIAQRDLELRGPGELLGTRQSGMASFRIADLQRDHALLPRIATIAERMLGSDPALADALIRRWLPNAVHYANT